ncbi:hypothetical protein CR194_14700 [Salipaludibacillus keqinensis]|uniref:FAD-dependent urate hydroxylase HpyO/Asp monooxygenase CreE-like FAD/NAD(P)-binding domain-containing protein n=1 Tax=Salipaludibacillus keqinensis TaxID=2045207 RepID=A0A323TCW8_9BACI|nr:FAD/NAD(P)-binding protein [Salipaludibacillus keqinensis]PYZ92889.1 hypothetical protein CR194_14700 [Salipaludibacillus keqinensis]
MKEWVIVGGGIQGITVAIHLIEKNIAKATNIAIIDPHDQPLEKWKRMTTRIGMPYLRSPFVHHLSSSPFSLDQFGKKFGGRSKMFLGRYHRPKLSLFNEHCEELLEHHRLKESWVKGHVNGLKKLPKGWSISLETGRSIHAKHVVLAIGLSHQLYIPDILLNEKKKGARISHIFEDQLNINKLHSQITVIGGGITAAHTAITLSERCPGQVTMIKRHPFRVHSFDSDPGWLGPKYMTSFSKLTDYSERRACIHLARHRGSITRELHLKLQKLSNNHKLKIKTMDMSQVSSEKDGSTLLIDEQRQIRHKTKNIICCTGFSPSQPGGRWLKAVIQTYSLPCSQCGYPIVDRSLMWEDHLYVSGALAELEIGPTARNISGAQKAAQRITSSYTATSS